MKMYENKKWLILSLLFLFCLNNVQGQDHTIERDLYLSKLYNNIDSVQKKRNNFPDTGLEDYRVEADFMRYLFYSSQKDTVYMVERLSNDASDYIFTAWNKTDTISGTRSSVRNKYYASRPLFIRQIIKLISRWDEKAIRVEEEMYAIRGFNESLLSATRIIFQDGEYQIDNFRFLEFEKEGRDDKERFRTIRRNERADKMPPQKH